MRSDQPPGVSCRGGGVDVADAVGVGVGDGEGVAAGAGGGEGDGDGVAPGDKVGERDAVSDGVALSGGVLTEKVALSQVNHSGRVADHSVRPVAHAVTRSVVLDRRPQVAPGRGTRVSDSGGSSPNSAYWTHQSSLRESPLATEPGEVTPEFQEPSTPKEHPAPLKPLLPEVHGAPRAMFKP
jgi:hypothetical protein